MSARSSAMPTSLCKSLFAAVAFFFTAYAFAYPAVGDKVEWAGSIDRLDGTSTEIKVVKEVLGHDTVTKKWTIKKDVTINSETTSETKLEDSLYSPEQYQQTIANCESNSGKIEEITVPAGTFKSCMLTTIGSDGTVDEKWWGDVPYGVVRRNLTEGTKGATTKLDLNSIINGL
ncbi:hypothetical protein D3C87_1067620 [compost metagenome]